MKILIIDKHPLFSSGLQALLQKRFKTIEIAESVKIPTQFGEVPELLLLNVNKYESYSLISQVEELLSQYPSIKCLAFFPRIDNPLFASFSQAGVKGLMMNWCNVHEFYEALRKVLGGESYVCSDITNSLLSNYLGASVPTYSLPLSRREKEVFNLLIEGKSSSSIAHQLKLCFSTVSTHKRRIFDKLQVSNVIELKNVVDKSHTKNRLYTG